MYRCSFNKKSRNTYPPLFGTLSVALAAGRVFFEKIMEFYFLMNKIPLWGDNEISTKEKRNTYPPLFIALLITCYVVGGANFLLNITLRGQGMERCHRAVHRYIGIVWQDGYKKSMFKGQRKLAGRP